MQRIFTILFLFSIFFGSFAHAAKTSKSKSRPNCGEHLLGRVESQIPSLQLEKVQDLLLAKPLQEGRDAFLVSASGLSIDQNRFFVIADDDLSLFSGSLDGGVLQPHQLMNRIMSVDDAKRKKEKADFEGFLPLNASRWSPFGAMIAWPSGSTAHRMTAVVLPFVSDTQLGQPIEVNIQNLAQQFMQDAPDLNIEAIVAQNDRVLFIQRGNSAVSKSGIFEIALSDFIQSLKSGHWNVKTKFKEIKVGTLNGVTLTLADVVSTRHGLLAIATAEDTASTYEDGEVQGTVLLKITDSGTKVLGRFEQVVKLEGMAVLDETSEGVTLMFVDDADGAKDASGKKIPSALFKVNLTRDQLN